MKLIEQNANIFLQSRRHIGIGDKHRGPLEAPQFLERRLSCGTVEGGHVDGHVVAVDSPPGHLRRDWAAVLVAAVWLDQVGSGEVITAGPAINPYGVAQDGNVVVRHGGVVELDPAGGVSAVEKAVEGEAAVVIIAAAGQPGGACGEVAAPGAGCGADTFDGFDGSFGADAKFIHIARVFFEQCHPEIIERDLADVANVDK